MDVCPTTAELKTLLQGQVPPQQLPGLRAHIMNCDACQQRLDQLTEQPGVPHVENLSVSRADIDTETALLKQMDRLKQMEPADPSLHDADLDSQELLEPPLREGDLGSIGPFHVLDELGRGGMGVVFLGFDSTLSRQVAIKVLRPDRLTPAAQDRFIREARAAAVLQHKNVVPVYDVSGPAARIPYLVMPVVDGQTVRQRISTDGPLSPAAAARVALHVCDGLNAAHDAGLIHRDIKPDNIIVNQAGIAQITDFGVVRDDRDEVTMTAAGVIPGTPAYMSPEQILAPEDVGPASDLYSLGITLWEMLTGYPACSGSPQSVVSRVARLEAPELHSDQDRVPDGLHSICMRATHKDPGQRYPSARTMSEDLKQWLRRQRVQTLPDTRDTPGGVWFPLRQHTGTTIVSLWLVAVIAFVLWPSSNAIQDREPAVAGTATGSELPAIQGSVTDHSDSVEPGHRSGAGPVDRHTTGPPSGTDRRDSDIASAVPSGDAVSTSLTVDRSRLNRVRQGLEARLAQGTDTVDLRLELVAVQTDLAASYRQSQQPVPALDLLKSATKVIQGVPFHGDRAPDAQQIHTLARGHFAIGREYIRIDRPGYAEEALKRAQSLWKQALRTAPDNTDYQSHLRATDQALKQIHRAAAG